MAKFRIQSHGRLQEWVAEEKGYFAAEGLDYEFLVRRAEGWSASIQDTDRAPPQVVRGAFESCEAGPGWGVSSACHWAGVRRWEVIILISWHTWQLRSTACLPIRSRLAIR